MIKKIYLLAIILMAMCNPLSAQQKSLHQLQQDFVDLRFGMFIHFNMPTFQDADWPDPQANASDFYPKKLDCTQWAEAAKSAGMTYGCLTTKHHSGFCIWDTKTTNYNVMNSPLKRDVVREQPLNAIVITDCANDRLQSYRLEYRSAGKWNTIFDGNAPTTERVKIHRFGTVWGDAVRMTVNEAKGNVSIAEFGVFNEKR